MNTEKITSIQEFLTNNTLDTIEQKERSLACPLALIVAAVALIVVAATPVIANAYLSMVVIFVGLALLVAGIIVFSTQRGGNKYVYIYKPTGEALRRKSVYVGDAAVRALKKQDFDALKQEKRAMQSSHCLEMYQTENSDFILLQLCHYENYNFVPVTEVIVADGEKANAVHTFMRR